MFNVQSSKAVEGDCDEFCSVEVGGELRLRLDGGPIGGRCCLLCFLEAALAKKRRLGGLGFGVILDKNLSLLSSSSDAMLELFG
jgi:hypothetical protein